MNITFNAGIDYWALEAGTANAVKVKSSSENRSKQSTSGPNCYDDPAVVDSWGETAEPSAVYDGVAALAHTLAAPKVALGALVAAAEEKLTDVSRLPSKYYSFTDHCDVSGTDCLISQTGYTGAYGEAQKAPAPELTLDAEPIVTPPPETQDGENGTL